MYIQMFAKLSNPAGPCCAVIIATKGRHDQLRSISLPSVCRQLCSPVKVILVADACAVSGALAREYALLLGALELVVLSNCRAAGAAGAWNTGLDYLQADKFDGFVALLDDDDAWDENHLSENMAAAQRGRANVVISGLRLMRDGIACDRKLPRNFNDRMFLTGNPGWQGSNTFVSLQALRAVGGFRDGMASSNDRDLAVRLLRMSDVRVSYTGKWTATWHLASGRQTLSSPEADSKLRGLRWLWQIYGAEMEPSETEEFFSRSKKLFGLERAEIISYMDDCPPHREPRGDFISRPPQ